MDACPCSNRRLCSPHFPELDNRHDEVITTRRSISNLNPDLIFYCLSYLFFNILYYFSSPPICSKFSNLSGSTRVRVFLEEKNYCRNPHQFIVSLFKCTPNFKTQIPSEKGQTFFKYVQCSFSAWTMVKRMEQQKMTGMPLIFEYLVNPPCRLQFLRCILCLWMSLDDITVSSNSQSFRILV